MAIAAAYLFLGNWFARKHDTGLARGSRIGATVVLLGFGIGAATATTTAGVVALWIAVLAAWGLLAVASVAVYRTVPHPDLDRRG